MMKLTFFAEQGIVQTGGETITLLPKEHALLYYLYRHANQLCTREQLLNAVWPMEYPTDRTVDDHIYRLRKKLKRWIHIVSIQTVRGQGYRLIFNTSFPINPLTKDNEITASYTALLDKYHLFGQGEAMQVLAANQSALGFRVAEEKQLYLEAVKGNFSFFLRPDLSFKQKGFYLLFLYWHIQPNSEKALEYIKKASARQVLPPLWHEEMKFNIIDLYIETKRFMQARQALNRYEQQICEPDMQGFRLFFYNKKLLLSVLEKNHAEAQKWIQHIEQLLPSHPYLREKGLFLVIKGLWLLSQKRFSKADTSIEEGLFALQTSRFIPHLIYGARLLRYFSSPLITEHPEVTARYGQTWEELSELYAFSFLEQRIRQQLDHFL
ncbi:winged helix-turn-helix domain-containing protein [Aneurinibacillus aneurinilyticus]|uniref:Winged helix-turn-helix transcriptional regulator n=2 Tax=Aneurinibacillus aneurinilyticus TaxID=1391 RepID=A0A848D0X2_ANEAE|nr:winged helix-turn-helix domain-containing protein [Aneurinibacillus aneurinilyticus]ERI09459.1 transcriptional regulatory protein [Aneurinibacillus aneurinilyticus ATCC 12856]MED0668888.1 winged helix-turn-helix domain-containing protein [Aneurinibacillus aneurinilyticus]MED0708379.1 winged helix-turn-helix domain-containing protein [Aneurinibacillus aneurinilyticus]MED0726274.1 winged helix-turn-helix domain-containing protein [Aneurinibacillus aneurinilyticus]MED0733431.1 winged helix-tur